MTVARQSPSRVEEDEAVIDRLSIYAVRKLAVDMMDNASTGDVKVPLGCAPLVNALWGKIMKTSTRKRWVNRDRFVLSNGDASPLLYSMLHLTGNGLGGPYEVSMDTLKQFDPSSLDTAPPVACPLHRPGSQGGFANAVGQAITERYLAARFNREGFPLFDHCTYVLAASGCFKDAVASEAASLASQLQLSKLIVFYEDDNATTDGFSKDIPAFFEAKQWNVLHMPGTDINDSVAFEEIVKAAKSQSEKPTIIIMKTSNRDGAGNDKHRRFTPEALRESEDKVDHKVAGLVQRALDDLKSWACEGADAKQPKFFVPRKVLNKFRKFGMQGDDLAEEWEQLLQEYYATFQDKEPELVKDLQERMEKRSPAEKPRHSLGEDLALEQQKLNASWAMVPGDDLADGSESPPAKRQKLTGSKAGKACAAEVLKLLATVNLSILSGSHGF